VYKPHLKAMKHTQWNVYLATVIDLNYRYIVCCVGWKSCCLQRQVKTFVIGDFSFEDLFGKIHLDVVYTKREIALSKR